ncbi:MAG: hypothetical protein Q4D62_08495 [Planctomycetia bacterium]|nr:hypothetical protein [Planctomycetia bacterium]
MNLLFPSIRFSAYYRNRWWGKSVLVGSFLAACLFFWQNYSFGKDGTLPPSITSVSAEALPRDIHPWGTFEPGAWRFSRTTVEKESSREGGTQRTVTDNRLTLQEKKKRSLTLILESQVTLMGKSVKMEPRRLHQDFLGLPAEKTAQYTYLSPTTLTIEGQPVCCTVVQCEFQEGSQWKQTTVWYSTSRVPFVFQREVKVRDRQTGECLETSHMRVTSMNMPVVVLGKVLKGYQYTQERRFPEYTSRENVVASIQIPGGVITKMFQDTGRNGKTIQKVTVELLDYGMSTSEHQQEMYRDSTLRSNHLAHIPPRGEDSAVRQQEFSMAFSVKSPLETGAAEISESPNNFQRFRDRWRKSQSNGLGETTATSHESESSDQLSSENSEESTMVSQAGTPCRSPIYNQNYRRNRLAYGGIWSGGRMVISTESLRFSTTPPRTTLEQNLELSRQNWRRHWRTFWAQAFTTE